MKKFFASIYTEMVDGEDITTTKIYADIPKDAADIIAKAEKWHGCHWDAPEVVFSEQVEGTAPSEFTLELIERLQADIED